MKPVPLDHSHFRVANSFHLPSSCRRHGKAEEITEARTRANSSPEHCQPLGSQALRRWNTSRSHLCPDQTPCSPASSFPPLAWRPDELPQRHRHPQPVPYATCAAPWHPWGHGPGRCTAVGKAWVSAFIPKAKFLCLLLGQTPLDVPAECGPRKDCSVQPSEEFLK